MMRKCLRLASNTNMISAFRNLLERKFYSRPALTIVRAACVQLDATCGGRGCDLRSAEGNDATFCGTIARLVPKSSLGPAQNAQQPPIMCTTDDSVMSGAEYVQ